MIKRPDSDSEFLEAMRDVTPLRVADRAARSTEVAPIPLQRALDDRRALDESLSEEIGVESLLDTDEALSYRREGVRPDTLRKLRRGFWVVQADLDLHGHRVEEAHEALAAFLRHAAVRGYRCVRIVHGKGLRSPDRDDIIAFCQARPADGGAGAVLVLLKPSAG
jgi:DNA-nicking Smr family endonuclease